MKIGPVTGTIERKGESLSFLLYVRIGLEPI